MYARSRARANNQAEDVGYSYSLREREAYRLLAGDRDDLRMPAARDAKRRGASHTRSQSSVADHQSTPILPSTVVQVFEDDRFSCVLWSYVLAFSLRYRVHELRKKDVSPPRTMLVGLCGGKLSSMVSCKMDISLTAP